MSSIRRVGILTGPCSAAVRGDRITSQPPLSVVALSGYGRPAETTRMAVPTC